MRKALLILASLAWAVYEVGFDWWQLGPRGGLIILIGLWLLVPWVRKPLGFASPTGLNYGPNAWPLALSVLASIVVAGYSMAQDPHDNARRARGDMANRLCRRHEHPRRRHFAPGKAFANRRDHNPGRA